MTDQEDPLIAKLFDSMGPAPIPPAMADDSSFLEGVYERAAVDAEDALGPVLHAGLLPAVAPEDATWAEVPEQDPVMALAAASSPAQPAPALLWTRIRADLRQHLADERNRSRFSKRRWVAGLAAAVLLSATLYGYLRSGPSFSSERGTLAKSKIVFRMSPSLSFDDRLIGG